ncbi:MAG TPA: BamA/TamA family outer membrane protein [Vicinamibacterales bacterium]|nr:BamA/TamA family outer membrane protein [Vicinamibacterales bacterium]
MIGPRSLVPVLVAASLALMARPVPAAAQAAPEVVAEIRVHGNHVTTDQEMLALAGVTVGERFEGRMLDEVAERLRRSGRFLDVTVQKRFASIVDPTRISLVILVNEGPVRLILPGPDDPDGVPRVVRRRLSGNLMWLPMFGFEDGYGVTYGVRIAHVGSAGEKSRISLPLTWGGQRRAGVDFSRGFDRGPFSAVEVGAAIQQVENPAFETDDTRRRLWGRAERAAGPIRAGLTAGWQRVDFGGFDDDLGSVGADVAFDTRLNPVLPRNAVFVQAAWERFDVSEGPVLHQTRVDARGYLGIFGQNVLVVRALHEKFNGPAPPYLQPLLGGWSSLRGFEAGAFVGDTRALASGEVLVPIGSPLSAGQVGVSAFIDTGTAFQHGSRMRAERWHPAYGGSVWVTFTAFRMSLAVAHGRRADTRIHLGGGFAF